MDTQTTQVDDLQLVAAPSALTCTDLFVRFTLTEWSLKSMIEQVQQPARQLVNAAVEAADQQRPGMLTVRLRLRSEGLLVEVEGDRVPAESAGDLPVETVTLDDGACLARCKLDLPQQTPGGALPRREPKRSTPAPPGSHPDSEVDPQVLQRILTSLGGASES